MRIQFRILVTLFLALTNLAVMSGSEGVRGVWVPAPRFTDVLWTHENVVNFVEKLDSLNMNSVFVVAYAETKTIFKSKVLLKNTTYKSVEDGYMLAKYIENYKSDSNDPIKDLIEEAHKKGIKVFFWFEYGFMGEGKPIESTNPILSKHPNWLGIGNDGKPSNYNKSDYYFNAFNPEVQNFLIDLIKESVKLYPDVDGIQGDDRMPAMPVNSGYDAYTQNRYRSEFGKLPPSDYKNDQWMKWRLNILNTFGKKLYRTLKRQKADIFVSFAPNPYPWCKDNLMQDWPEWCKMGICDLLAVQCYRYDAGAYKATVEGVLNNISPSGRHQLFAPGIILPNGKSYPNMKASVVREQIEVNRSLGLCGEIFFYNKGLNDADLVDVLKEMYKEKLSFPRLK